MLFVISYQLNKTQRKETAKLFLGVCQLIIVAILAGPFVPGLTKLTQSDRIYGAGLVIILYLIAIKLLKDVE